MRWYCWSLILFQFVWLNVVVPGHTRGAITGPGTADNASPHATADTCCAVPTSDNDDDSPPSPDDRRRCAVCYLAAGYTIAPVFQINLAPTGLIPCAPFRAEAQAAARHIPLPYFPAGPPALTLSH